MTANPTRNLSTERRQRLGLLTEPLGYVDGQNMYEYAHSAPVGTLDPSGTTVVVLKVSPDNEPTKDRFENKTDTEFAGDVPKTNKIRTYDSVVADAIAVFDEWVDDAGFAKMQKEGKISFDGKVFDKGNRDDFRNLLVRERGCRFWVQNSGGLAAAKEHIQKLTKESPEVHLVVLVEGVHDDNGLPTGQVKVNDDFLDQKKTISELEALGAKLMRERFSVASCYSNASRKKARVTFTSPEFNWTGSNRPKQATVFHFVPLKVKIEAKDE